MIKKILMSSVVATTTTFSAYAADLPARMPPPPPPASPPVFTWTGFYIGVNGGYYDQQGTQVVGTPIATFAGAVAGLTPLQATAATFNLPRTHGGLAGGQVGYNWQANQYVVLGVEGDFDGAFSNNCGNNNGGGGGFGSNCNTQAVTLTNPAAAGTGVNSVTSGSDQLRWLATLRGRLGILPLPNLLVYGTGGVAFGQVSSNVNIIQTFPGTVDAATIVGINGCNNNNGGGFGGNNNGNCVRVGGTAGGGVEWMFLPGWSVKAEALYYQLRSTQNFTFLPRNSAATGALFGVSTVATESRPRGFIARAGLNYHFTWGAPAPVVARY